MSAVVSSRRSLLKEAARSRNKSLALELSSAATEGDDARVRSLMAELLRCQSRRPEERFRLQLQALEDLFHTMRSMAMTDDLTGLNNRRGFFRVAERLLDFADREGRHACVVHADVDDLKRINDSAGHHAGDLLLRRTADALRQLFPNYDVYDVIGRLGGDEFAVLTLSEQDVRPERLAWRIAEAVGRLNSAAGSPELSLSVGVAVVDPARAKGIRNLLEQAEGAMYRHKSTKRCRRMSDLPCVRGAARVESGG